MWQCDCGSWRFSLPGVDFRHEKHRQLLTIPSSPYSSMHDEVFHRTAHGFNLKADLTIYPIVPWSATWPPLSA